MAAQQQAPSQTQLGLFGKPESGVFRIADRSQERCYGCGMARTIAVAGRCAGCSHEVHRARSGPARAKIILAVIADARAGLGTLETLTAEAGVSPLSVERALREVRTGSLAGQRRAHERDDGPRWDDPQQRPPVAWLRAHAARLVDYTTEERTWPELCAWGHAYALTTDQLSELVCWAEDKEDLEWTGAGWRVAEESEDHENS